MNNQIITDITNFIFIKDEPQRVDAIFLPGGSHPEQPLNKNGVPLTAIIGEDKSGHTRDNAFMSRTVADDNNLEIKTAIIVCKSFHARRCLMLYSLAFPDTKCYVCPVDCMGITSENWYKTEQGIDRVLGELARCGNQFVSDIKEYLL